MLKQEKLDKFAQKCGYHAAKYVGFYNGMEIYSCEYVDHIFGCEGYPEYFGVKGKDIIEFDDETNLKIMEWDCQRVHGSRELDKEPGYHAENAKALLFEAEPARVWAFVSESDNPHVIQSDGKLAVESTMAVFGLKPDEDNEEWKCFIDRNKSLIYVRKDCEELCNAVMKIYSPFSLGDGFAQLSYGLCELCNKPYRIMTDYLPENQDYSWEECPYGGLTRYIPAIGEFDRAICYCHENHNGKWLMPRYEYTRITKNFINDAYLIAKHDGFENSCDYVEFLKTEGLNILEELPDVSAMSSLSKKALHAVIWAIVDREKEYPGQIYAAIKTGYMDKLLACLKEKELAEQKVVYENGLKESIFEDDIYEYLFNDGFPFAIFVGSKDKRQGMLLKAASSLENFEILDVYGEKFCYEYLQRLGVDQDTLPEGWSRIDMEGGDYLLLSKQYKVSMCDVLAFTRELVELYGEYPFYKWIVNQNMDVLKYCDSMYSFYLTHTELAEHLAILHLNFEFDYSEFDY